MLVDLSGARSRNKQAFIREQLRRSMVSWQTRKRLGWHEPPCSLGNSGGRSGSTTELGTALDCWKAGSSPGLKVSSHFHTLPLHLSQHAAHASKPDPPPPPCLPQPCPL